MIARELCEHLSHMEPSRGVKPAAVVACAPMVDRSGESFSVTDEDIAAAIDEALQLPIEPLEDTVIPDTLLTEEQIAAKKERHVPEFVELDLPVKESKAAEALRVVQKKLSNGIKVNIKSLDTEPQRANLRLYIPGVLHSSYTCAHPLSFTLRHMMQHFLA